MSIWFKAVTLEDCARLDAGMHEKGTLMQTLGIVHGGANVALAETVASYAANFVVDFTRYYCVGQEINANHLKASRNGELTATTKPIHIGKRSSVWEILIHNSAGQLCCISRMTAAVVER